MANKAMYPHVPKKKAPLYPHVTRNQKSVYEIDTDRIGNIIITRTDDPGKDLFLQLEGDKSPVYDLLKKGEREDLDRGWSITVKRTEPRASILDELWEVAAQIVPQTLLAKTEGDPISKYCCQLCSECAPEELLEEGRFLDRISWLRLHYKEKHPGMWGKMSPMTVEDGELVPLQYHHLADLVSEPLPKDAY